MHLDSKKFRIYVRPGKKNRMHPFDEVKGAYIVDIQARPEKGKANQEVVRFLSKEIGMKVVIRSGLTSRYKIIEVSGS